MPDVTTRKRATTAATMPITGISTSPDPAAIVSMPFFRNSGIGGFEDPRDQEREDAEPEQAAVG